MAIREYTTKQGDTWDVLAFDIYGSEKLTYVIQEANPDFIDYIYFPAGIQLTIPETPETAYTSNLPVPPWER